MHYIFVILLKLFYTKSTFEWWWLFSLPLDVMFASFVCLHACMTSCKNHWIILKLLHREWPGHRFQKPILYIYMYYNNVALVFVQFSLALQTSLNQIWYLTLVQSSWCISQNAVVFANLILYLQNGVTNAFWIKRTWQNCEVVISCIKFKYNCEFQWIKAMNLLPFPLSALG